MVAADLEKIAEIDGTIESRQYLHLGHEGHGLASAWKLEERDLREKLIEPNRLADEARFAYRQVVGGLEEGTTLAVEVEGSPVATLVAVVRPEVGTLQLVDLRVDYDYRRQGFATALLYQLVAATREREDIRAIYAEVAANNSPAQQLLERIGFTLSGFDERRRSNHDLVKEAATLLWYLELEA